MTFDDKNVPLKPIKTFDPSAIRAYNHALHCVWLSSCTPGFKIVAFTICHQMEPFYLFGL